MVKIARVALVLLMASTARAETVRFFGSTAGEWQTARANQASPLNPGNLVGIERQTGSADLSAFFDVVPESRRFKFHFKLRGDSVERAGSHAQIGEGVIRKT